jgi:hypothetical protein
MQDGFLRGVQNLWGTMLLQFIFSMSVDFGTSMRLTMTGFMGTVLAVLNMFFMNDVLQFMNGGANAHRFATVVQNRTQSHSAINSDWLPLCNDGFNYLTPEPCFCLLNVWWSKITMVGFFHFSLVLVDFVVFVFLVLLCDFDSNTRIFALSVHVYFMTGFVDPHNTDYAAFPAASWNYLLMITVASFCSIACFQLPRKRYTALESAEWLCKKIVDPASLLIKSMPDLGIDFLRQKSGSISSELETLLDQYDKDIAAAWYEDFGRGTRAKRRRWHQRFSKLVRTALSHIQTVRHVASLCSVSDRQYLEERLQSLHDVCDAAGDFTITCHKILVGDSGGQSDMICISWRWFAAGLLARENLAQVQEALSPEAQALSFAVSAVAATVGAASWRCFKEGRTDRVFRLRGVLHTTRMKFGFYFINRSATHPRFVLRNTLSITFAFLLGWVGVYNVMGAYSSVPASTISVIVYTYSGSTTTITIRRVAGVVLGRVLGTVLQLGLAVKSVAKASAFVVSMWFFVLVIFFLYVHSDEHLGYVFCLTAGYMVATMVPDDAMMREEQSENFTSVTPSLLESIIGTVIGVSILAAVDVVLGSKATHHARQRLLLCFKRLQDDIKKTAGKLQTLTATPSDFDHEGFAKKFHQELGTLKDLLPYAESEPQPLGQFFGHLPFKGELYWTLAKHFHTLGFYYQTMIWAMEHGEQPSEFRPMAVMLTNLSKKLAEVRKMANEVTENTKDYNEAASIRDQLRSTTYTGRLAHYLVVGTGSAVQRVARRLALPKAKTKDTSSSSISEPGSAKTDTTLEAASASRKVCRSSSARPSFLERAISEDITHSLTLSLDATANAESMTAQYTPPYDGASAAAALREHAAGQSTRVPHKDGPCRAELLCLLVTSMLHELEKMKMLLMEY